MTTKMSLVLIIGCMFSGKTTELIRRVERHLAVQRKVIVVNHSSDSQRSGEGVIKTHSGRSISCCYASKVSEVPHLNDYEIVAINEGQFFPNLEDEVHELLRQGKHVIVCGLDADFKREIFLETMRLVPHATELVKTTAFCALCRDGTIATYSMRTNKSSDERVLIGGDMDYIPVCYKCFT